MRTLLAVAVLLGMLSFPKPARALTLKNVRPTTGRFGATRKSTEYLPGGCVYLSFQISDITTDSKTNDVKYQTKLEVFDDKNKAVLSRTSIPQEVTLSGGTEFPSYAFTFLSPDQPPGNYTMKVTVKDFLGKQTASFTHRFRILPPGFGIVQQTGVSMGLVGQDYGLSFAIVGMMKDEKTMLPEVLVTVQMTDTQGGKAFPKPREVNVKALHSPLNDLTKKEIIPISLGFFLNRPGRFIISVTAEDKIANRKTSFTFPLRVLDSEG
ncbi:MAG: hypothetical protein ACFCD0_03560 [Gemmataceae bacterium]